jgi:integrase
MSAKGSHTTSDYIEWDKAINCVHRLFKDKDYRMSAYLACGIFTGLRVSDLRQLRWSLLMGDNTIEVVEKKTKKRRIIKLNPDFQEHIKDCYKALKITNPNELCFLSQKKTVYSTQRLNIKLKEINKKYRLGVKNMSNHSMRKALGRRAFDMASETSKELCLIKLSELFNHSDTSITKRYLGLKQEEILETYDLLTF